METIDLNSSSYTDIEIEQIFHLNKPYDSVDINNAKQRLIKHNLGIKKHREFAEFVEAIAIRIQNANDNQPILNTSYTDTHRVIQQGSNFIIENPDKKALQGERIETPDFIKANNLKINYSHYITNQIMKPIQQLFALVLEKLSAFKKRKGHTLRVWKDELNKLKKDYPDETQYQKKEQMLRNKEVKILLFDDYLNRLEPVQGPVSYETADLL